MAAVKDAYVFVAGRLFAIWITSLALGPVLKWLSAAALGLLILYGVAWFVFSVAPWMPAPVSWMLVVLVAGALTARIVRPDR